MGNSAASARTAEVAVSASTDGAAAIAKSVEVMAFANMGCDAVSARSAEG